MPCRNHMIRALDFLQVVEPDSTQLPAESTPFLLNQLPTDLTPFLLNKQQQDSTVRLHNQLLITDSLPRTGTRELSLKETPELIHKQVIVTFAKVSLKSSALDHR